MGRWADQYYGPLGEPVLRGAVGQTRTKGAVGPLGEPVLRGPLGEPVSNEVGRTSTMGRWANPY